MFCISWLCMHIYIIRKVRNITALKKMSRWIITKYLTFNTKGTQSWYIYIVTHLYKILVFDAWHITKSLIFLLYILLTHKTLSVVFFLDMTLCQQFFFSLIHQHFSIDFSLLWRMKICQQLFTLNVMFVMFFWKVVKFCSVYNVLFLMFSI